jgi:kynurenine formamidase
MEGAMNAGALALALVSCAESEPEVRQEPALEVAELEGRFRSNGCETFGEGTAARHLTRELAIEEGTWRMEATLFDDERCAARRFRLEVRGALSIAGAARGITAVDFTRTTVELTPLHERAIVSLVGRCGGSFEVGVARDLSREPSCPIARSIASCPVEHDVVELREGALHLGDRSGDLCAERPERVSDHGLARVPRPSMEHLVDLTHTLTPDFPFIPVPGTFAFSLEPIATFERDHVAANRWNLHEHIGTQIDAPLHFESGGADLSAIPIDELLCPVVVIDVRDRAARDDDTAITVDDLLAWEAAHGPMPRNAAVLMNSGWAARVRDPARFVNRGDDGALHFPGFSEEAARFLAEERDVRAIGVDTLSIDPGRDTTYAAHRVWLRGRRWALEVLARLDDVPAAGAWLLAGAPKVEGATGGPVRVVVFYGS